MTPGLPARRLAVCADDHGSGPRLSAAIVELAQRGRINALSCLTAGEHWFALAAALHDLPPEVERGLHFNLTEGAPVSAALRRVWPRFPSLPRLLIDAGLGRLPLAAIGAEWQCQWDRFVDATGHPPAFVDGHQHVHHLPGVRNIVLAAVAAAPGRRVAVRNTGALRGPGAGLKRLVIRHSGGVALQTQLRRLGLPHNAVLLGAYDFQAHDYRAHMRRWLRAVPPEGALLFCHPGAADGDAGDPIAAARAREAAYLGSDDFAADLLAAGVSLGPVWRRTSSGG